jgi:hypothetical protein
MNRLRKAATFLLTLSFVLTAEAAVISGTVTGPDGFTGLSGIEVTAWHNDGDGWYSYLPSITDATGQYIVNGDNFYETNLSLGEYRVDFHDPSGSYAMETYDNVRSFWQGDAILISSAGQAVTGIDASLAIASSISGILTGPDGITPVAGIEATAWIWDGGDWYWLSWVESDSSGNYTIDGLPTGIYKVDFYDPFGDYVTETYNNALIFWEGDEIVISSPGQAVSGIDASLSTASSISGSITGPDGLTPLEGIEASAMIWDGGEWSWLAWGFSDTNGNYTITGLPAGNYRVEFRDSTGLYASELYDDAMPWEATEIAVSYNTAIQGVDASLGLASHIAGTVTGSGGSPPLEYIEVAAYIWSGSEWVFMDWADTDSNGDYAIGGLPPGIYQVDFFDYDGIYAYEVFNDAPMLGLGSSIVLSAGQTVGNINVSMSHVSPVVVAFYRTGPHSYQVDFTGIPGVQYMLQETDSLLSAWGGVGSPVLCEPGTNQIPIQSDDSRAFWRIMEMP